MPSSLVGCTCRPPFAEQTSPKPELTPKISAAERQEPATADRVNRSPFKCVLLRSKQGLGSCSLVIIAARSSRHDGGRHNHGHTRRRWEGGRRVPLKEKEKASARAHAFKLDLTSMLEFTGGWSHEIGSRSGS